MKILSFLKREPVLTISALLAVLSMLLVPPDGEYIGYFNLSVLAVLFCLMLVVAALSGAGVFDVLMSWLGGRIRTEKALVIVLCLICFFTSALITNDVALITFVPFSLALLKGRSEKTIIFAVTMETVAANLGSLITPIGNPQNLYLYTYFNMQPGEFFRITLPLGGICLVLLMAVLLCFRGEKAELKAPESREKLSRVQAIAGGVLFVLCLLTVLRLVPWPVMLLVVMIAVLIMDKALLREADYILLLTFVCFFVFVGNAARLSWVYEAVSGLLKGREILISAALSQVVSNVPAATMLSAFTSEARGLVIGTNIGGLGTLIASMASLISYRRIAASGVSQGRYIKVFTAVNFALLAVLGVIVWLLF